MKRASCAAGVDVRTILPRNDNNKESTPFRLGAEIAKLRGKLRARALFLAQDSDEADDLVQATIEKALVASARFEAGTNIQAWLNRILRNLFIDVRRTRGREISFDGDLAAVEPDEPDCLDVLDTRDLDAAVATLRPWQREIFALAYRENMSYREIAERLTLNSSTVGTRLMRVKDKLREHLEQVYADKRPAHLI